MIRVMVAGAGKIGRLIACLLADTKDYQVYLGDCDFSQPDMQQLLQEIPELKTCVLDMTDAGAIETALKTHQITAIISSLPYFLNINVAKAAKASDAHYFDLTEDIAVAETIKALAVGANTVFVPQCGMAPGFVSMVAHSLMETFDVCHEAKLRVGALPQQNSNALHYSLTWSTDGLINECGEACAGIEGGKPVLFAPLEGLESIQIDGNAYEAFHTSGGLGGLGTLYAGKVDRLTYKTIRYPGHCEKMRFLMQTLRLNEDRETLKKILERAIPKTTQDMVLVYVSVEGMKEGVFVEESYVKKIYPETIRGIEWSAIQLSTASAVCAVLEQVLAEDDTLRGLVLQEHFHLETILNNRFGRFYV
ncbi:MAG: saccharopine dehydrogenase C-terminal domain-containing protein [Legionellaceae bacterium]|nr:saccharopine dehydrogenase C-terminal domain-containing protein [Legionellaceae bacterium]